jgi:hypothetical protein
MLFEISKGANTISKILQVLGCACGNKGIRKLYDKKREADAGHLALVMKTVGATALPRPLLRKHLAPC